MKSQRPEKSSISSLQCQPRSAYGYEQSNSTADCTQERIMKQNHWSLTIWTRFVALPTRAGTIPWLL
jgi:hypothetical protein